MTQAIPPQREEAGLAAGDIFAGRYTIVRRLGRGGFADVFLARHVELDSLEVAVKVLHPAHRDRASMLERFRREAKLLSQLRNRHTVRLIDFGADEGAPFLVMEFVHGAPLDRLIKKFGALDPLDVGRVGIGVLKGLIEAHSTGVIHRDLKPGNIILVREPGERHIVPRILDFGIASVLDEPEPEVEAASDPSGDGRPERVFCTPAYAAPEVLLGHIDHRSDLYALGLVLAEMIEGVAPYDMDAITAGSSPHLLPEPVPFGPRVVSSGLLGVLQRACAKDMDDRFQTAEEMLEGLERAIEAGRPGPEPALPHPTVEELPWSGEQSLPKIDKAWSRTSQFVPVTGGSGWTGPGDPTEAPGMRASDVGVAAAREAAKRRGVSVPPLTPEVDAEAGLSSDATAPAVLPDFSSEVLPAVPMGGAVVTAVSEPVEVQLFGNRIPSTRLTWEAC